MTLRDLTWPYVTGWGINPWPYMTLHDLKTPYVTSWGINVWPYVTLHDLAWPYVTGWGINAWPIALLWQLPPNKAVDWCKENEAKHTEGTVSVSLSEGWTNRPTDRETDGQADRQTDRETDGQADRQVCLSGGLPGVTGAAPGREAAALCSEVTDHQRSPEVTGKPACRGRGSTKERRWIKGTLITTTANSL